MVAAQQKSPRALADHRKVGNKYIPPLTAELGPLTEIRWVNDLVPEFVWLALLSTRYGPKMGTDLARRLALAANAARGAKRKAWFALTSAYAELDPSERDVVVAKLEADGAAQQIREALTPLLTLYPECPLRFLFVDLPQSGNDSLEDFKTVLESIFDKGDIAGTFAQATAVYIAFVSDMLRVFKGLALANFPAIEDFPNTEESQRVASSVRSTVLIFYSHFKTDHSTAWISYFWKHGLDLDDCKLDEEREEAE